MIRKTRKEISIIYTRKEISIIYNLYIATLKLSSRTTASLKLFFHHTLGGSNDHAHHILMRSNPAAAEILDEVVVSRRWRTASMESPSIIRWTLLASWLPALHCAMSMAASIIFSSISQASIRTPMALAQIHHA
jgi:hypothetical protein